MASRMVCRFLAWARSFCWRNWARSTCALGARGSCVEGALPCREEYIGSQAVRTPVDFFRNCPESDLGTVTSLSHCHNHNPKRLGVYLFITVMRTVSYTLC